MGNYVPRIHKSDDMPRKHLPNTTGNKASCAIGISRGCLDGVGPRTPRLDSSKHPLSSSTPDNACSANTFTHGLHTEPPRWPAGLALTTAAVTRTLSHCTVASGTLPREASSNATSIRETHEKRGGNGFGFPKALVTPGASRSSSDDESPFETLATFLAGADSSVEAATKPPIVRPRP